MNRKLALLIGNSTYGPGLPPLEKPDADIAALAKVLANPAIGGFDEVKPLFDATSATVRLEVARFFSGRSPDDLLLLYFSGHGLRNDRGGLYLAVQDTETALLSGTAIPAAFISEEMDNCRSRRQILILDCCYSGAFEHGAKGPASNPATAFRGNGLGRFVLTASDSTQLAWEDVAATSTGGLSVFTRHLVGGLESGEADLDGDGLISVDELYDYVYARVVEENPRQTPGKSTSKQQGEIFIARNPAGPKLRPLPAELTQALDHPLATVREGAVRELARFLRGSDAGLAEAARKAAEQARDDDSRRVSTAAAEVLAAASPIGVRSVSLLKAAAKSQPDPAPASEPIPKPQPTPAHTNREGLHSPATPIFSAEAKAGILATASPDGREPIPLQRSVPQPQRIPAFKSGKERSTAPAKTPFVVDSPSTSDTSRRSSFLWVLCIILGAIALIIIIALVNSKTTTRNGGEVEPLHTKVKTQPAASIETPAKSDTTQALLTEAKSWPLVLADSFDSAEADLFGKPSNRGACTTAWLVSSGVLQVSTKAELGTGCMGFVSVSPATATADSYLRVEIRNFSGSDNATAGLLFRISPKWDFYAFMIDKDSYSLAIYTANGHWKYLIRSTTSAAIRPEQTNSLAVIARQSDLIFFINDQKVGQFSDATLSSGTAGLFIKSYDTNEVTFDFDNFELRRSPEASGAPPAGK